jgi:hypothetical protein
MVMRQHTCNRFACCIVQRGMSASRHASLHNITCKTNERMLPYNHTWRLKFKRVILNRVKKLPDDDHPMIETCWSDFKCFSVWHLNECFITNKCISWTIIYSELKCTAKQWKRDFKTCLEEIMNDEWKRENIRIKSRCSEKMIDVRKQYTYFENKMITAKTFIMKTWFF